LDLALDCGQRRAVAICPPVGIHDPDPAAVQAADDGRDRNYTWSVAADPADPDVWFLSASTGPFAAHGGRDAQARIYRREGDRPWEEVADPGRAMPYALAFGRDGRLFAALSDGRILEGREWRELDLRGDRISELHALAAAV
jgi:hypothetical protein